MVALRHLHPMHRRWLLLLVAVVLCARALVPAGWMPVAGTRGVALAFCSGAGPMPPMAMPQATHRGAPMEHHQGAPDHPCDFTAAAATVAHALPVAPLLPPALRDRPAPISPAVAIGRGLAAPPPPATGPPAFV